MSHWMLAATLICGVTMFTACTTNIDNPGTKADVAPSVLYIMGMKQPIEMTGRCLIKE